ncbi:MAG: hypothetical protein K6E75_01015 [Lachnospiraceae bacterium]|nr:hypothetical protein [Lachnospiraceae bacterium]
MLRFLAAALLLFIWPLAAGNLILSLRKGHKNSFAGMIAEGAVCMLAVFEVLFLIISNTGRGLSVLAVTWLVVTILVFACSAVNLFLRIKARSLNKSMKETEKRPESGKGEQTGKRTGTERLSDISFIRTVVLPLLISTVVIMAAACISKVPAVSEQYRVAETTVVIIRDGTFFGTDPLTGWWLADVTPDQRVEALPAFYAVLCYLTGMTKPWQLLGTVAAVWVILLALSVLYEAADLLLSVTKSFEKKGFYKKHFWVLCAVFCLCALCVGDAYRNPFYDLVHVPYEGRTILSFLILPVIFLSMISLSGIPEEKTGETDARIIRGTEKTGETGESRNSESEIADGAGKSDDYKNNELKETEKKIPGDDSNKERSKEEKHGKKGLVILHAILCIMASALAALCTCGIGCGLFPALCELLVLVVCLIGWNLQKRFTA